MTSSPFSRWNHRRPEEAPRRPFLPLWRLLSYLSFQPIFFVNLIFNYKRSGDVDPLWDKRRIKCIPHRYQTKEQEVNIIGWDAEFLGAGKSTLKCVCLKSFRSIGAERQTPPEGRRMGERGTPHSNGLIGSKAIFKFAAKESIESNILQCKLHYRKTP